MDPPVDEVGELEEVEDDDEDGWDESVELVVVRVEGGLRR